MRHYYDWRRNIRDKDMIPNTTAIDWDANFERVGNHYTIRLNKEHRVHFDCDFLKHSIKVHKIGTHDL